MPTSVSPSVTTSDVLKKLVCREKCFVCSQGIDLNHLVSDDNYGEEDPGHQSAKPRWRTRLDSFHSIGAAVMSCRNDKAPDGLSAHAHLADGLLHLILIKSCSRPNYLRYGFCMRLTFVPLWSGHHWSTFSHSCDSWWDVDILWWQYQRYLATICQDDGDQMVKKILSLGRLMECFWLMCDDHQAVDYVDKKGSRSIGFWFRGTL